MGGINTARGREDFAVEVYSLPQPSRRWGGDAAERGGDNSKRFKDFHRSVLTHQDLCTSYLKEVVDFLAEGGHGGVREACRGLTQCINQTVLENQLPHKIVNLLFNITHQNHKLTVL